MDLQFLWLLPQMSVKLCSLTPVGSLRPQLLLVGILLYHLFYVLGTANVDVLELTVFPRRLNLASRNYLTLSCVASANMNHDHRLSFLAVLLHAWSTFVPCSPAGCVGQNYLRS